MRFFWLYLLSGVLSISSYSQTTGFSEGYYVIIGAFAIKENAYKYNESVHAKGMRSSLGYLSSRGIYYVYTLQDANPSVCIEKARELRKEPAFSDAWVRYINENVPVEEKRIMTLADVPAQPVQQVTETPVTTTVAEPEKTAEPPVEEETEEKIIQYDKMTLGNTEIFLSLYNMVNNKVADGVVKVIDTDRAREIEEAKGNTYLMLPDPKSKSGNLTLICEVLGYRKIQKEINFNNPTADSTFITQMGTNLVANFELVKYHVGDFRTLYNIYFYNDAAVMMPESKYELNALLSMMKENPNYRIRLHGHSNGNSHGKIIKVTPGGDFFSVAKDATTTIGSAKELSESRAEVIKDWLVAQGIDASRVEVKAWGGKRPIYDKNSANAKKNIRVEVELISQ